MVISHLHYFAFISVFDLAEMPAFEVVIAIPTIVNLISHALLSYICDTMRQTYSVFSITGLSLERYSIW